MAFCKNHKFLYFDNLLRTKKVEAVLSLIMATYQATDESNRKEQIATNLKPAYELFKFSAGSYSGSNKQFESQYTIGHELGIWLNKELDLNRLAIQVAENKTTIREYFDIVFLNYIQPIDNNIIHPLYLVLDYLNQNSTYIVTKQNLADIFSFASESEKNNINGFYQMLLGSNYFSELENNKDTLSLNVPLDVLIACCNLEYVGKKYEDMTVFISDQNKYVEYLIEDHRSYQLVMEQFLLNHRKDKSTIQYNDLVKNSSGINKLYYGIPGCGKSYYIEHDVLNGVNKKDNVFRTTFYLDYSNSDFIGQIYPIVKGEKVEYQPVPGPFTKALARAFDLKQKNVNDMVYLVIEEINRGNAAAIFGDTFQLLDRLKEPNDGRLPGDSEYPISNEFIEGYFEKEGIAYEKGQIYIPHNLTILATMNTSDQNVFPLDTAFKRRWNRQLMKGNWENCDFKDYLIPGTDLTWQKFADAINNHITSDNNGGTIMEDKKLGPFFANKEMFKEPGDKDSSHDDDKLRMFIENVMDYLYADVCKFDKEYLFEPNITFDKICELAEHLNGPDPMPSKCLYLKEELFLTEDAVNDDETEEAA